MARWKAGAVGRLQEAALELFDEQGFERTTVAEITERAGLTKRSFFNHFPDKREVLFGPVPDRQRQIAVDEIGAADPALPPLVVAVNALLVAAETLFADARETVARRRAIIAANPELFEREMAKRSVLAEAIAAAFVGRGIDARTAAMVAQASMVVSRTAMDEWLDAAADRPLAPFFISAIDAMQSVVAATGGDDIRAAHT